MSSATQPANGVSRLSPPELPGQKPQLPPILTSPATTSGPGSTTDEKRTSSKRSNAKQESRSPARLASQRAARARSLIAASCEVIGQQLAQLDTLKRAAALSELVRRFAGILHTVTEQLEAERRQP